MDELAKLTNLKCLDLKRNAFEGVTVLTCGVALLAV